MTKTPRNEFDRLVDQDPADGLAFDESALIANLKERLPEASLSDEFPDARTSADTDTQAAASLTAAESEANEGAPKTEADPEASSEDVAVVSLESRKRKPLAWGQIAASVAITSLIVGAGATAVANNGLSFDALSGSSSEVADSPASADEALTEAGPSDLDASTEEAQPLIADGAPQRPEGLRTMADGRAGMGRAESGAAMQEPADASYAMAPFYDTYRNRFVGQSLSSSRGSATAYGFDETQAVKKETFEKLQDVLGVEGKVTQGWGSYSANHDDQAYLYTSGDGTGSFDFNTQQEVLKQERLDLEKSLEQAKELMTELGVDVENYTFKAEETDYWTWIEPAVARKYNEGKSADEQISVGEKQFKTVKVRATRNELGADSWAGAWDFDFSGDKLITASGSLAELVDLGEYPVVSQQEAVERLNDPQFGVSNMNYPTDIDVRAFAEPEYSGPGEKDGPQASPVPQPGVKFDWAVGTVTLTSGTLTVAQIDDGSGTYMLPVWEFSATNGATYQVLALADTALNLSPKR